MARILYYPSQEASKENFIKKLWDFFVSLDNFTKVFLITFLFFTLAIPIITRQYLEIRQFAVNTRVFNPDLSLDPLPNEILIKYKPGITDSVKENILLKYKLKKIEAIPKINIERVETASVAEEIIEKLKEEQSVEYAEKNFRGKIQSVPNDVFYLDNTQWNLLRINTAKAWDISTGTSSAVIAILDSGVNKDHEDLSGKILPGHNFVDNSEDVTDKVEHGIVISGIIGAVTDNKTGVASLGWNLQILPVKIVDDSGYVVYSNAAKAIIYAADKGVSVINLGFGGEGISKTVQDAINYAWGKNIVIVAPAGNEKSIMSFPASANNVISVGAIGSTGAKSSFSNTGPELDLMAPGEDVYSTSISGYKNFSGTSIASAHVAALAGLIISANPKLINKDVENILTDTANGSGWNSEYGWGIVNAEKALKEATNFTAISKREELSISITNPLPDTMVLGIANIYVSANSDVPISKVDFSINGKIFATDEAFPYVAAFETASMPNGAYTLKAKAYDITGKESQPSNMKIFVNN
ncbi:hypothetical protein C4559_01315 [Candidatus Microgenomates bacterium]|nr:MAG: hypothetical protein C4559_01315 [Candidatus Microgenomates bacterium]